MTDTRHLSAVCPTRSKFGAKRERGGGGRREGKFETTAEASSSGEEDKADLFMCISATIHFVSIAETNPQLPREASIGRRTDGGGNQNARRRQRRSGVISISPPALFLSSLCLPLPLRPLALPSPPHFSSASHITAPLAASLRWRKEADGRGERGRERSAAVARH